MIDIECLERVCRNAISHGPKRAPYVHILKLGQRYVWTTRDPSESDNVIAIADGKGVHPIGRAMNYLREDGTVNPTYFD